MGTSGSHVLVPTTDSYSRPTKEKWPHNLHRRGCCFSAITQRICNVANIDARTACRVSSPIKQGTIYHTEKEHWRICWWTIVMNKRPFVPIAQIYADAVTERGHTHLDLHKYGNRLKPPYSVYNIAGDNTHAACVYNWQEFSYRDGVAAFFMESFNFLHLECSYPFYYIRIWQSPLGPIPIAVVVCIHVFGFWFKYWAIDTMYATFESWEKKLQTAFI